MVELMISMQYIEALFIINFFACAVSLGLAMLLVYRLFKSLEKKHPKYYKSIGEPILFGPFLTEESYIQGLKGGVFGYTMVFRGIPINFPKDIRLRKLTQAIRVALTVLIILSVTFIIVGYFFYKSGLKY